MKIKSNNAPTCIFCKRTGNGVQFNIFTPRFKPFGTACTDCEEKIPKHIKTPEEYFATQQECNDLVQASATRQKQFNDELAALLAAIKTKATDQFHYNETTNIPMKIIGVEHSVPAALSHGMASGWNTVNHWSCDHAISLAHEILEDANCHTEAARLCPREQAA